MSEIKDLRLAVPVAGRMTGRDRRERLQLRLLQEQFEPTGVRLVLLSIEPGGDRWLVEEDAARYDAVILMAGRLAVEPLCADPWLRAFVTDMQLSWKPIGAIGDGGRILVSAGLVRGRTMIGSWAIEAEVREAGAVWVDEEDVVVDHNWVTCRGSPEIPVLVRRLIPLLENIKAVLHGKEPLISKGARSVVVKARVV